jgi:hypothetical protein
MAEIPDAGLLASLRQTLNKPTGQITVAEMESLRSLDASLAARPGAAVPVHFDSVRYPIYYVTSQINNLEGLQAAQNLTRLDLSGMTATLGGGVSQPHEQTYSNVGCGDFSALAGLTNLTDLNLSANAPSDLTFLAGLINLTNLDLDYDQLTSATVLPQLNNLQALSLNANQLTNLIVPGLSNLITLDVSWNPNLGSIALPPQLANLTTLSLDNNLLTNVAWSDGLSKLATINLGFNLLDSLTWPPDLRNLSALDLEHNHFTTLTLPPGLAHLTNLNLNANQLTGFTLAPGLTNLTSLDLGGNQLTNVNLDAGANRLTSLDLSGNQLSSLTLPIGMTNLTYLSVGGNPLTKMILPEPPVANLNPPIETLRKEGVAVYVYPLQVRLIAEHMEATGQFAISVTGPPGTYRVQVTSDFSTWTDLEAIVNLNGIVTFTEALSAQQTRSFFRVKTEE